MKFGNVDIPNALLDDLHNNKVVVFAGAGVSMGEPTCLPNFKSLTKMIAKGTGVTKSKSENHEQFLGRLHDRGVKVHQLAKTELSRERLQPILRSRRVLCSLEVSTYVITLQQAKLSSLVVIEFFMVLPPFSFQSLCSPGRFSDLYLTMRKHHSVPLYFSLASTPVGIII